MNHQLNESHLMNYYALHRARLMEEAERERLKKSLLEAARANRPRRRLLQLRLPNPLPLLRALLSKPAPRPSAQDCAELEPTLSS